MKLSVFKVVLVIAVALLAACNDPVDEPTEPQASSGQLVSAANNILPAEKDLDPALADVNSQNAISAEAESSKAGQDFEQAMKMCNSLLPSEQSTCIVSAEAAYEVMKADEEISQQFSYQQIGADEN